MKIEEYGMLRVKTATFLRINFIISGEILIFAP
jgi:hypothetical protein